MQKKEIKIQCPNCKNSFSLSEKQIFNAGYKKALMELTLKLQLMEVENGDL